ncbi:putative oligopeptide transporter [Filobasidium floriforme]|uniref:putative oligopeptide transporter n=1 Tax=Filobasidium floriforme TaxID=5210 RepID=UPI001E8D171B|nr:putative oligopeptide transporter [Filobasidium floriforme]KAH8083524.1 putative oligopeptide transporter [Filobasidium floriforme]
MTQADRLRQPLLDREDQEVTAGHDEHDEVEYEGDFTLRAVVVGLLVGVLLAFTNLYFGLQSGWISMMSLQSSLLGFAIFKLPLPRFLSPPDRPFTAQENVVVQTTAVATGTLPLAAGLVGIIPALEQLDLTLDGVGPMRLSFWQLIGWSIGICFFGVFLAVPLRKQVIVKEKLVFPSGTATAQLIALLFKMPPPKVPVPRATQIATSHSTDYQPLPTSAEHVRDRSLSLDADREDDVHPQIPLNGLRKQSAEREEMGRKGWYVLGSCFAASAFVTLLSFWFPVVFAIPIFDLVGAIFNTSLASTWLWWFTPSLSYVGQGIIMNFETTLFMNLGMITGWAILSPLAKLNGWAPGPVSSSTNGARGWILWVSLAIMISESIISLIPVIVNFTRDLHSRYGTRAGLKRKGTSQDGFVASLSLDTMEEEEELDPEPPHRLVPDSWVVIGLGCSAILGIFLVWWIFGADGISPWATAVGLVLASILSLLGVRALGETDLNPVSGIGKISQLLFAVLQPGNVVANIIAGGVAEAGAQQAGDLMQDLKTGSLLKASPRSQFYGQMIGSFASVFVSVGAYKLYTSIYEIPGPEFQVPTAAIWLNLARLLNTGHLPPKSAEFMIAFGLLFAVISSLRYILPLFTKRATPRFVAYLPSGIAFAIGFLNVPSFSLARLIGGIVALRTRRNGETPLIVIVAASGLVLGEGVISIVGLGLAGSGQGAASCWGCNLGHGGYCSRGC